MAVATNTPDAGTQQARAPAERLSMLQTLGFGLGGIPLLLTMDGPKLLVGPIYNIILGVNPTIIAVGLMASRLWDAMADPLMGVISDNARTRFGRRIPFIVAGALLSALAFPLIWLVQPGWNSAQNVGFLIGTLILFYSATTIYSVPYQAVSLELTPNYAERTRLSCWWMVMMAPGTLLIQWTFRLAQSDRFSDALTGMRYVSLLYSAVFIVFGIVPCFFVHERFLDRVALQPKSKVWQSVRESLACKPFRVLMGMTLLIIIGYQSFSALGIYVNTYYVFGGDSKEAAKLVAIGGTIYLAAGWVYIPIVNWIARRWGKIPALKLCLTAGIVGGLARWFLYRPEVPYLQLIEPVISYPAATGFWVLVSSLKADICDIDEFNTGMRREATFAAVSGWLQKLASALTFALTAVYLVSIGFEQRLGGGQAASTLTLLRVGFSALPIVVFGAGIILIRKYDLTAERMHDVRAQLESRRGVR